MGIGGSVSCEFKVARWQYGATCVICPAARHHRSSGQGCFVSFLGSNHPIAWRCSVTLSGTAFRENEVFSGCQS